MKWSLLAVLILLPVVALAITEPKTETHYPDQVTVDVGDEPVKLVVTGVGLREKTMLKVDVYTIVSYLAGGMDLGDDKAKGLREIAAPKRIQMNLRRGFSCEKLKNSFKEVIEKNYDDTSAFDAELELFLAYFDRDAQEDDELIFDYATTTGLVTTMNGEVKGSIASAAFAEALWTVWFGEKPANKGLRDDLLSVVK